MLDFRSTRFALCLLFVALAAPALGQVTFATFESGHVRPLAISPDGTQLFAVNTPDNRLEIFDIATGAGPGPALTHVDSVPVGMEPVAVAAHSNTRVWVVNHLSDSVSIVDLSLSPPAVVATLLVGDEPRDIVFAGAGLNRAFISTAHRGQHRTHASISGVPGAGDPQFLTPSVPRADLWVFDVTSPDTTLGGTPLEILSFFADTPRGLATDAAGDTVFVAAFPSGNQTTTVFEGVVCDGFGGPCALSPGAPGGNPGPSDNAFGAAAPEVGLIVQFKQASGNWEDELGRDWSPVVNFNLPDHDVFSIDANTLAASPVPEFDHVGTILFNMAVNPVSGRLYVTNMESPNLTRFEGPGHYASDPNFFLAFPPTVQGHLSETRISVINTSTGSVDPQHLNQHIDYTKLHTAIPDLVDTSQVQHSLATPLQIVVSSDGAKIYMAAFGSSKVGVFDAADIEDVNFEANFDPSVESANYIPVDGGPSGIALDEINNRLYVLTRFNNSVSSIPLPSGAGPTQTSVLYNPEPQSVVDGRPLLYDAVATSGNGEASCASCHIFGDNDDLAWDLGDPDNMVTVNNQPHQPGLGPDFHPMKGPMTTQTLRGLSTHGGMHWRGDRVTGAQGIDACNESPPGSACNEELSFNNFIVAFEGLVGKDGTVSEADMQKFTDFALQLMEPPNPVRTLDNSLTPSEASGLSLYLSHLSDAGLTCNDCHALDPLQGFFGASGLQTREGLTQDVKVPHLRNDYTKVGMFGMAVGGGGPSSGDQIRGFGLLHDGSVDTLTTFLGSNAFQLMPDQVGELAEFTLAFDSDLAPMVGQQVTRTVINAAAVDPRIDQMIASDAAPFDSLVLGGAVTECDLIVKGSVGGLERGWVRQPGGLFADDIGGTISDTDLRALALSEGPLTYTAVPPGSGTRMGIERDEDNLLDGVETNTGTFVDATDTGTDPANPDTDGDGFDDGVEVAAGTDPTDASSFPGSGSTGLPALPPSGIVLLGLLLGGIGACCLRRRVRVGPGSERGAF